MSARQDSLLSSRFLSFIDKSDFPCIGAKAALSRGALQTMELGMLGDRRQDHRLLVALTTFVAMLETSDYPETTIHSFAVLFHAPLGTTELTFENLLWHQLWRLHRLDEKRGMPQARDVSNNTNSAKFSLSIASHPFFVIGLHSGASRISRRFRNPALVFNSHRQFEQLRSDGRYSKMQANIRKRDHLLQGSINPNLADFGAATQARQYSGRDVGKDWQCPYDFS